MEIQKNTTTRFPGRIHTRVTTRRPKSALTREHDRRGTTSYVKRLRRSARRFAWDACSCPPTYRLSMICERGWAVRSRPRHVPSTPTRPCVGAAFNVYSTQGASRPRFTRKRFHPASVIWRGRVQPACELLPLSRTPLSREGCTIEDASYPREAHALDATRA